MNPIVSICLNADFDGDQVAVSLPLTEAGQKEARERLSLAGHLRRDPSLLSRFIPYLDALWGLAWLSLSEEGLREICDLAECEMTIPEGYINRAVLTQAMAGLLRDAGPVKTLAVLDLLRQKGLEAAKKSGASISPFAGEGLRLPPVPQGDEVEVWEAYCEEARDIMASRMDFHDFDLGPQLLAVRSEARGSFSHLACLVGPRGLVVGTQGDRVPIRHGWGEGMSAKECFNCTVGARKALATVHDDVMVRQAYGIRERDEAKGYGVLARAMRSKHPGNVFARAAASGEVDPLRDVDSRLFVGLPVHESR
jgi:DNA-directed RNA polymerase subunit beta'